MTKLFEPVQSQRRSSSVAEAIRRVIVEGHILPGETLPPERELAERFQVTRNTVREALRDLEQQSLVTIRQGSGIRVKDWLAHAGLEVVSSVMAAARPDLPQWMADVAEARVVVGGALLDHCLEHLEGDAVPRVVERIESFCAEATGEQPDIARLQTLDVEIHAEIVRGAGNRALILLHNTIQQVYERVLSLFTPLMTDLGSVATHYRKLSAALAANDRKKARRVMREYFEQGRQALCGERGRS